MVMPSGSGGEPGRVSEGSQGPYIATGVMLLLFGLVEAAWTVRGVMQLPDSISTKDWFVSLVDPSVHTAQLLPGEPFSVALTLSLLIVSFVALARRRVARGAAVLVSFLTLYLMARALVAVHNDTYRHVYLHTGTESLLRFVTFGLGVLLSLVVLIVIMRASEASEQQADVMGYGQQSGW